MTPVPDLITKHHEWGSNILGLLLVFITVGLMFPFVALLEANQRVAACCLLVIALVLPGLLDVWWRQRTEPRGSYWRFFLPGSGGALLFVPIWLYCVGNLSFPLIMFVSALIRHA